MIPFQPDFVEPASALAIIAGHYCVSPELDALSPEGAPEESSFAAGVQVLVAARRRGGRARLTVWINDIGIDSAARKALKEQYRLPENYLRLLERAGLDRGEVGVQFESSTRNKASTHVKRLSARSPGLFRRVPSGEEGLVRCVEACATGPADDSKLAYVIDGPEGEPLVVKDGPHPKCNLILATLFDDAARAAGARTVVTAFNGIYLNRIRLGMFVAVKLLGLSVGFENLYTFDDYSCARGEKGERRLVPAWTAPAPISAAPDSGRQLAQ